MARIIPPTSDDDADSMLGKFRRHAQLKSLAADLTKQAEILKKELAAWVDTAGYVDDKGSKWVEFESPIEGFTSVQWQRRATPKLDETAAERILTEHGLADRCYTTVRVLDEQEVMACLRDEVLTDADIDTMFPVSEAWAFVPTKDKK